MSFSLSASMFGADVVRSRLEALQASIQNAGEGLLTAAVATVFPAVVDASSVVWDVRTYLYESSWSMGQIDNMTIAIANDVDYSAPLEFGWTLRDGGFRDSPGVLIPAVLENMDALAGEFKLWLTTKSS